MNRTLLHTAVVRGTRILSLRSRIRREPNGLTQPNGFRQPNGFTLMELLIVIAIILILMLMAIPTISSLTKKGNETSAINSVRR